MYTEQLKIKSKFADKNGEVMIIALDGYIDHTNSSHLQKIFNNTLESDCVKIIVDFTGLNYMSSVGWGIFVGEIKQFRDKGGDIKLANMKPDIYDVFQMLEFYHILDDFPSVDEAFDAFKIANGDELNYIGSVDEDDLEDSEETATTPKNVAKPETEEIDTNDIDDIPDIKVDFDSVDNKVINFSESKKNAPPKTIQAQKNIDTLIVREAINLSSLPNSEKIKHIIAKQPLLSLFGIKKVLRHEQFGFSKIGLINLYRLLRDMDMETKQKRYRYYRSC